MLKELARALAENALGTQILPRWAEAVLTVVHIPVLLAILWLIHRAVMRLVRAFVVGLMARVESAEERRRIETLGRVARYVVSVLTVVGSVMLVLSELGISIAPLLAGAGVAGLAIGFGAQSLVKDYFSGIVMLIENQIRQGDVVEVAGKVGLVEEVTLRYVRLRDYEGAVHYVPNGHITTVTNRSRQFAFAVMDVGVGYNEDLDRVTSVMRKTAEALQADPLYGSKILEAIEIAGVETWADSAVVIRSRIKVVALEQGPVRREYLRRLKQAFDAHGIEIPFPHRKIVNVVEGPSVPSAIDGPG